MDSNHDIVQTLRLFDGVMTGLAADEIEALRKRVAELEAAAVSPATATYPHIEPEPRTADKPAFVVDEKGRFKSASQAAAPASKTLSVMQDEIAGVMQQHMDSNAGVVAINTCALAIARHLMQQAASPQANPAEAREPSIVASGLVGLARHVRAVPAYSKLVGDMDIVDQAIAMLNAVPADAGEAVALTAAARDVLAERARQVSVEGWTPEHDDQYTKGELALAASQYVLHVACPFQDGKVPAFWPWPAEWWKPTTPRRDLEKAGALIQAEIERLYRAEAREQGAQGGKGGDRG